MTRRALRAALLLAALSTCGCTLLVALSYPSYEINYETCRLPAEATRFAALCTPQDDYNAAPPPTLEARFPLVFSSNRGGPAAGFDLVAYAVSVDFDQDSGELSLRARPCVEEQSWSPEARRLLALLERINSPADELGPTWLDDSGPEPALLFTSDREGHRELYRISHGDAPGQPLRLEELSSPQDEGYACPSPLTQSLVFCSNRSGRYQLLEQAPSPLAGGPRPGELRELATLNSPRDDRCPFVSGDRLVFCSNRPGGQGGYDLYLSRYAEGRWAEPVNLGSGVNSPADEFRPVIVPAPEFENDLLLFSSDRPGGAGGYDLYWAGLERAPAQSSEAGESASGR